MLSDSLINTLNLNIKSNNYLVRSYIATQSKNKGGYLAIEADKDGFLLEGSLSTVAVLLKNGDFVVPPVDRIIPGTTAIKIFKFIEQEVVPKQLLSIDYIKRVVRRDILITEAIAEANEVMLLSGEECVPVLEWDGVKIGDGKKGQAVKLF